MLRPCKLDEVEHLYLTEHGAWVCADEASKEEGEEEAFTPVRMVVR